MSITFNNPINSNPAGHPGKKPEKSDPAQQSKQRERERLQKQQHQIKKRLERLSFSVYQIAKLIQAQDESPMDLFALVRPILSKMGIANVVQNNKTAVTGETNPKKERLYQILLRRDAIITDDIINRIKRNEEAFERMGRSKSGEMEIYIWGPPKEQTDGPAPIAPR